MGILGHICAHIQFKHDNLKPYFFIADQMIFLLKITVLGSNLDFRIWCLKLFPAL